MTDLAWGFMCGLIIGIPLGSFGLLVWCGRTIDELNSDDQKR